jgi:hypothetical protein
MDRGPEPITDRAELAQVRRQARAVHVKAVVAAAVATALLLMIARALARDTLVR